MTSYNINWQILLLSFVLACGLWYGITVRDRLEMQAEINLSYKNMPENLLVREGLGKNYVVQLRGPRELIKNLDTKTLSHVVDLSVLRPGSNSITLGAPRALVESRAIEVMAIYPPVLVLEVEQELEKSVPLELKFASPSLAQALKVDGLLANVDAIVLRGAESLLKKVTKIAVEVPIESDVTQGKVELVVPVPAPAQLAAQPDVLLVSYTVVGTRTLLELERVVLTDARNPRSYTIDPPKLRLQVELPESLATNKNYLAKIRVVAAVQNLLPGQSQIIKPLVELPEGAHLAGISPTELKIGNTAK